MAMIIIFGNVPTCIQMTLGSVQARDKSVVILLRSWLAWI